ncbi:hypothetical protein PR048_024211 [Dryococelus australis]|uniref:Uncharacterized protein n=1 Tax=Dryococelus australis TaxID=614101 RepID=A0ABQ9GN19_9NEOP|nr:hypothetical protein PR048_024211 [Dryococelus australis]
MVWPTKSPYLKTTSLAAPRRPAGKHQLLDRRTQYARRTKRTRCSEVETNVRQLLQQPPLHSERITVWYTIAGFLIVGPYIFQEDSRIATVTSARHIQVLNYILQLKLNAIRKLVARASDLTRQHSVASSFPRSLGYLKTCHPPRNSGNSTRFDEESDAKLHGKTSELHRKGRLSFGGYNFENHVMVNVRVSVKQLDGQHRSLKL